MRYDFDGHKLIYHPDRVAQFLKEGDCYPLYMELSPVGSCNHRCVFCAYDYIGYPNRRLETDRTLRLLDELAECGVRSILFAGEGEPLLHPDIDRFIRRAWENGIDAGIFTNGELLDAEMAEKLLPCLTFVRFSVSGGGRENYAAIHTTKPAAYDAVMRNIRRAASVKAARALEVDIGAQFVVLRENIDHLREAAETLRGAGVDYLAIKPFVLQSVRQGYRMKALEPELLEERLREVETPETDSFRIVARRDSFARYGRRGYRRCHGTSFISVVNSAGEVGTCLPYWDREEFLFGNIQEGSFREIWNGNRRRMVVKNLTENLEAHSCPPNCRCNAVNEFLWELRHPTVKHVSFI